MNGEELDKAILALENKVGIARIKAVEKMVNSSTPFEIRLAFMYVLRKGIGELVTKVQKSTTKPDGPQLRLAKCQDGQLPDGPECPCCGKERAPSGIDGGSWVHVEKNA